MSHAELTACTSRIVAPHPTHMALFVASNCAYTHIMGYSCHTHSADVGANHLRMSDLGRSMTAFWWLLAGWLSGDGAGSWSSSSPMHTYKHTCLNVYIHACMHACVHTYIHIYMHTYIHTYIRTYMHVHMHTCMHACMRTCIQTDTHTHTHIHAHVAHHFPRLHHPLRQYRPVHSVNYQFICVEHDQSSDCLLYTSPSPRDRQISRMPSSA